MAASDEDYLPPVTDAAGNPLPLDDLDVGMMDEAPREVRRAAANIPETGVLFNLEPFEQIAQLHAAGRTDEARKIYDSLDEQSRYVYNNARNMERFTAQEGARLADEFRRNQDRAAAQAADPKRQTEAATAQMALSEKQMKLQEHYRQELTYQRLVGIMNNPKTPSAQWNAARIQLEGLSASIGQRMIPAGTSADALSQKKDVVGYIGALESKNPLANFGPRFNMMQRESQDRIGLLRQQMEAGGVPVPEMAAEQQEEQAPPDWVQISMQKNAVLGPDGGAMTIQPPGGGQPQPIIKGWNQGKQEYRSVGPDGMFYFLTPQQLQQLGLE